MDRSTPEMKPRVEEAKRLDPRDLIPLHDAELLRLQCDFEAKARESILRRAWKRVV